jgi:hypothetical protein
MVPILLIRWAETNVSLKEGKVMGAKKLSVIVTATLAALALVAGTAFAIDIPIANSGFESGNTGFTSGYAYNIISGGMLTEGSYSVGSDPNAVHSLWASFPAHSGTQMMMVNGAISGGAPVTVWAQTVAGLEIGTEYFFSAWVTSVYPPPVGTPAVAPALLAFSINGTELVPDIFAATTGNWSLFYRSWTATATTANLSLINRTTDAQGNDFAIDDIRLSTSIPTPEPTTLLLLGLGLIGMAGVRRFRK